MTRALLASMPGKSIPACAGKAVAVFGYLEEPDDIRNRIGNGEIEVVAGGVEW